eukprot:CAMPEP_0206258610 /NCGR_PEP_ID=MMETSP0047_2-20121206/26022_1 /ASSEMBLY_ACC=CAM_ASM_000192 /TAXON_ID=195065 /ORGANISM="Chroomonas mesostigmatica_cf, Strain CCMP1168" /LENGTH=124 /DNA_ID=CAMNT_0053685387 /DNA_START=156 /DNA_END=530 /DNA_ORIENTATION=+
MHLREALHDSLGVHQEQLRYLLKLPIPYAPLEHSQEHVWSDELRPMETALPTNLLQARGPNACVAAKDLHVTCPLHLAHAQRREAHGVGAEHAPDLALSNIDGRLGGSNPRPHEGVETGGGCVA